MRVLFDTSIFIHANYHITKKFSPGEVDSTDLAKKVVSQIETIYMKKFEGYDVVLALEGGNNFRKSISDEYKSHRSKLEIDFALIENILRANFQCIKQDGLEADDIAYVYSRIHKDCILVSEDNDYYLMLDEERKVYKYKQQKFVQRDTDSWKMECLLKICGGCKQDEIGSIKLRKFGPSFMMKFIQGGNPIDIKDSLDLLEAMDYISDWTLNYELAMYDIGTYCKYIGEDNVKQLIKLCQI